MVAAELLDGSTALLPLFDAVFVVLSVAPLVLLFVALLVLLLVGASATHAPLTQDSLAGQLVAVQATGVGMQTLFWQICDVVHCALVVQPGGGLVSMQT